MGRKSGLVMDDRLREHRSPSMLADVPGAWRWVGWFGVLLAVAAIGDWVLAWVPFRLGNPEWEFGTVAASVSGLPLMAMGFAGALASALARGARWQVHVLGWVVLMWGLLVLGAVVVFLLDVPLALRTVEDPARIGIVKASIKTTFLGLGFAAAYLVAGFGALRHTRTMGRHA